MTVKIIEVEERTLERILTLAREGEEQVVTFSRDNEEMAYAAAALSKDRCGQLIEAILEILT